MGRKERERDKARKLALEHEEAGGGGGADSTQAWEQPGKGGSAQHGQKKEGVSSGRFEWGFGGSGQWGMQARGPPVPEDTKQYVTEIMIHYKTLINDEEKGILASNVLEEVAGKEKRLATDQACSRHIEQLLSVAPLASLLPFLGSICKEEGVEEPEDGTVRQVMTSPFGSHVIEKVMLRLEKMSGDMTEAEFETYKEHLTAFCTALCADLYTYACDRYATHVARRLICLAAGRNVLPPTGKKVERGEGGKKLKGPTNLGSKVGGSDGGKGAAAAAFMGELEDVTPEAKFPEIIQTLLDTVSHENMHGPTMLELVYHQSASPFLQAIIKAISSDRPSLLRFTPCVLGATVFSDKPKAGKVVEFVDVAAFHEMARDPTASHVVEAVVQASTPALFEELFTRYFKGNLADLAHHPMANFVVQAALAATKTTPQIKAMFEELDPQIGKLLVMRRSGVVAALLASCGRLSACQKDVCASLSTALSTQAHWSSLATGGEAGLEAVLAPALLCLDAEALLGKNEAPPEGGHYGLGPGHRLSSLGALILINVLKFGQGSCRSFTDSVAALGRHDAVRVGRDPSGSRVLETFLEGSAPIKVKYRFLTNLVGGFGDVALTAAGSFVMERCYSWADPTLKEKIVQELCARSKELESLYWGPNLLQTVGSEAYNRDPVQWRKHMDSSTKTMAAYTQLFGSAPTAGSSGPGGKNAAKTSNTGAAGCKVAAKTSNTGAAGGMDAAKASSTMATGQKPEEVIDEKKKLKRELVEGDGDEDGDGDGESNDRKKKKKKKAAEEVADLEGQDAGLKVEQVAEGGDAEEEVAEDVAEGDEDAHAKAALRKDKKQKKKTGKKW